MSSKRYVRLIRKYVEKERAYFARHGIDTDKLYYIDESLEDELLESTWNAKEYEKLSYNERIKKIVSIIVFPTNMSIAQAEAIQRASVVTGQNLSFAEVLQGKFDWEMTEALRHATEEQYLMAGYDAKDAKRYARLAVGQQFFGSL